ncbi:MAG: Xaa-Pro peptidase family protein [Syntrophales bacterium]|nr:Xaa-Pro peptidase family protein [Syntrophales bacterium]
MSDRREALKARLSACGVETYLLFDMNNIRYLTGFRGEEGLLLFHGGEWILFVDGRYVTQAREELPRDVEIVLIRDVMADVASYIRKRGVSLLAVEAHALSVANFRLLRHALRRVKVKEEKNFVAEMRVIKDEREIEAIKRAVKIAEEALRHILPLIQPGIRERDIAIELDYQMKKKGAEHVAFPTIVASGPRSAMPHAKTGSRILAEGDTLVLDFGVVEGEGYCSDETCTFLLGRDEEVIRAYQVVKEAQKKAIEAVRPGVNASDVDRVAREFISEAGYGEFFAHGTGHGIGLEVHELPRLSPKSRECLKEGMVITVEPGIYMPGRWGIRLEDMVLVTETGGRLITSIAKELNIID